MPAIFGDAYCILHIITVTNSLNCRFKNYIGFHSSNFPHFITVGTLLLFNSSNVQIEVNSMHICIGKLRRLIIICDFLFMNVLVGGFVSCLSTCFSSKVKLHKFIASWYKVWSFTVRIHLDCQVSTSRLNNIFGPFSLPFF